MSREIKEMVERCQECARVRVNHSEPLIPSELPQFPWQRVGADLFQRKNTTYLLAVNYRSRYPDVFTLSITTSESLIERLKSVFARHGIPHEVITGNGPQFSPASLDTFFKQYNSQHVTSSPYYPQSNGEAERMVRAIKELFSKNSDPYIGLLNYQNSPGPLGLRPA